MQVWSRYITEPKTLRRLSPERYEELVLQQKGVCAICGKVPRTALVMDYKHGTQIIRGLLCVGCNTGLGKLGDSIEGVQRALEYLIRTENKNIR